MANILKYTSLVARDSAILLRKSLKAASVMPGEIVGRAFATKVGQEIEVKTRSMMTATRHYGSGPFTVSDISQPTTGVKIGYRAVVKHKLTAAEKTFELDDFTATVVQPAMIALAEDIDLFLTHGVLAPQFARHVTGTDGNDASTLEHIANAWQKMFELKNSGQFVGLLTPTTAAKFLQLQTLTSRDYADNLATIRQALFNPVYNMDFFPVQNCSSIARGDTGGGAAIQVSGTQAAGATALTITGITSVTGFLRVGTRFTIAGDTTVYTVIPATTAITMSALNDIYDYAVAAPMTVNIYPALAAQATSTAVITIKAAAKENVIFAPDATAKVIIAPEPQIGNPSAVESFEGLSVRVTYESTINDVETGDAEYVQFDTYVGGKVLVPDCGLLMQG